MKKQSIMAGMMVLALFSMLVPEERADTDEKIREQIMNILNHPVKTYRWDVSLTRENLKRLDRWILGKAGLSKEQPVQKKGQDRKVYRRMLDRNSPIFAEPKQKNGLRVSMPFMVRYEQDGMDRCFRKSIRVPTRKQLPESRVIELGKTFVLSNQLISESDQDRMIRPLVVAWRHHQLKENLREDEKYTILQRVIFNRNFNGIEVINARIMVDIHPDSEEILSFNCSGWKSIEASSGSLEAYISLEDALKQLDSATKEYRGAYQVVKIDQQFYQSSDHLIPVLVVHIDVNRGDERGGDESMVLVINLLKDISFDREMEKLMQPEKPVKQSPGSGQES